MLPCALQHPRHCRELHPRALQPVCSESCQVSWWYCCASTCATNSAARLQVPARADARRDCFALKQGATNSYSCCHDVIVCWDKKEDHETLSPMFPAQAPLPGSKLAESGPQIHEAPSAPLQFVSLMKSPIYRVLQRIITSRALSFDSRKTGDERPNAVMFLPRKQTPGHSLQRTRFAVYAL